MTTGAVAVLALLVGAGATLATDLWAQLLQRALGIPAMDLALVGRWFGHLARGRFAHRSIAQASPVRGEHAIGDEPVQGHGSHSPIPCTTSSRWISEVPEKTVPPIASRRLSSMPSPVR